MPYINIFAECFFQDKKNNLERFCSSGKTKVLIQMEIKSKKRKKYIAIK